MTDPDVCSLCKEAAHDEPTPVENSWLGISCPGHNGTEEERGIYSLALTKAIDEEIAKQETDAQALDDESDTLQKQWANRQRNPDVTPEMIQADVDARTDAEVSRQKVAQVFQTPEFEIDVPHLTVPAKPTLLVGFNDAIAPMTGDPATPATFTEYERKEAQRLSDAALFTKDEHGN